MIEILAKKTPKECFLCVLEDYYLFKFSLHYR